MLPLRLTLSSLVLALALSPNKNAGNVELEPMRVVTDSTLASKPDSMREDSRRPSQAKPQSSLYQQQEGVAVGVAVGATHTAGVAVGATHTADPYVPRFTAYTACESKRNGTLVLVESCTVETSQATCEGSYTATTDHSLDYTTGSDFILRDDMQVCAWRKDSIVEVVQSCMPAERYLCNDNTDPSVVSWTSSGQGTRCGGWAVPAVPPIPVTGYTSLEACKQACQEAPECKAVEWRAETYGCTLFDSVIVEHLPSSYDNQCVVLGGTPTTAASPYYLKTECRELRDRQSCVAAESASSDALYGGGCTWCCNENCSSLSMGDISNSHGEPIRCEAMDYLKHTAAEFNRGELPPHENDQQNVHTCPVQTPLAVGSCEDQTTEADCINTQVDPALLLFGEGACTWCCGDGCTGDDTPKCQPHTWLLAQSDFVGEGVNLRVLDYGTDAGAYYSSSSAGAYYSSSSAGAYYSSDSGDDSSFEEEAGGALVDDTSTSTPTVYDHSWHGPAQHPPWSECSTS